MIVYLICDPKNINHFHGIKHKKKKQNKVKEKKNNNNVLFLLTENIAENQEISNRM